MRFRILGACGLTLVAASMAQAGISIGTIGTSFFDISTTGASIGTLSDDSETTVNGLGWVGNELLAGGVSIRIGNNGGILWGVSPTDSFSGATEIGYYNAGPNNSAGATSIAGMPIKNTSQDGNGNGIRQFIAPLWDDYVPVSGGATTRIYTQVVGNDLYVQWHREDAFAASGSGDVTFQAIFRGGVTIASGLPLVEYIYWDTVFQPNQYQNDGGSATIGYKNWNLNANANDVEYGIGGGGTSATSDPAFGGLGMQPKVAGQNVSANPLLPKGICIAGNSGVAGGVCVPEPTTLSLLGLGALAFIRRRK